MGGAVAATAGKGDGLAGMGVGGRIRLGRKDSGVDDGDAGSGMVSGVLSSRWAALRCAGLMDRNSHDSGTRTL